MRNPSGLFLIVVVNSTTMSTDPCRIQMLRLHIICQLFGIFLCLIYIHYRLLYYLLNFAARIVLLIFIWFLLGKFSCCFWSCCVIIALFFWIPWLPLLHLDFLPHACDSNIHHPWTILCLLKRLHYNRRHHRSKVGWIWCINSTSHINLLQWVLSTYILTLQTIIYSLALISCGQIRCLLLFEL